MKRFKLEEVKVKILDANECVKKELGRMEKDNSIKSTERIAQLKRLESRLTSILEWR